MLHRVLDAFASALSIDCWIPPSEEPVISTDLYTWSLMSGGDTRARRTMRSRAPRARPPRRPARPPAARGDEPLPHSTTPRVVGGGGPGGGKPPPPPLLGQRP